MISNHIRGEGQNVTEQQPSSNPAYDTRYDVNIFVLNAHIYILNYQKGGVYFGTDGQTYTYEDADYGHEGPEEEAEAYYAEVLEAENASYWQNQDDIYSNQQQ